MLKQLSLHGTVRQMAVEIYVVVVLKKKLSSVYVITLFCYLYHSSSVPNIVSS